MKRSPLRMRCKKSPLPRLPTDHPRYHEVMWMCKWRCEGDFRAAKFQNRYYPDEYAVLHPSTKEPGKWQLSLFDERGPYGDRQGSCEDVLQDLSRREWRLARVVR